MTHDIPDREFREMPIFPDLHSVSLSYAFELLPLEKKGGKQRTAYRLLALSEEMLRDREKLRDGDPDMHEMLVEPVRSFLDDVTNGAPGINGRPLLFLASGAPSDDPGRVVTMVRPPHWDYRYEGELTRLDIPDARQRLVMRIRDSFCIFESGRAYYIVSLVQPDRPLDEYAVIHAEQLVLQPSRAADPGYLGFEWIGAPTGLLSLIDLANARLRQLRAPAPGDPPNGLVDLIRPYGLLAPDQEYKPFSSAELLSLCAGVEDAGVLASARYAYDYFEHERDLAATASAPAMPDLVANLEPAWAARCAEAGLAAPKLHRLSNGTVIRPSLAIAGLATGVPDFPYQDGSEAHDSTRSTSRSVDSALFTHPRFMFEVGTNWRSFSAALSSLGTCPYLLMTWMVTIHDEQTVSKMERMLEDMIYDPTGQANQLPRNQRSRAEPLADVMQLLGSAASLFGHKTAVLQRNLRKRLEMFRWEAIHRSGNMFRYPKEKAALHAVREAMGTQDRFDEVHQTLDRFENLVEDVSDLASSYAERRTNRLLGALAALAVFGIPASLADGRKAFWEDIYNHWFIGITALVALALAFVYFVNPTRPPRP